MGIDDRGRPGACSRTVAVRPWPPGGSWRCGGRAATVCPGLVSTGRETAGHGKRAGLVPPPARGPPASSSHCQDQRYCPQPQVGQRQQRGRPRSAAHHAAHAPERPARHRPAGRRVASAAAAAPSGLRRLGRHARGTSGRPGCLAQRGQGPSAPARGFGCQWALQPAHRHSAGQPLHRMVTSFTGGSVHHPSPSTPRGAMHTCGLGPGCQTARRMADMRGAVWEADAS